MLLVNVDLKVEAGAVASFGPGKIAAAAVEEGGRCSGVGGRKVAGEAIQGTSDEEGSDYEGDCADLVGSSTKHRRESAAGTEIATAAYASHQRAIESVGGIVEHQQRERSDRNTVTFSFFFL